MKEQDKTPEKQLNEVEIGNLPEKEFRIMTVKMIQDLGKRMMMSSVGRIWGNRPCHKHGSVFRLG